MSTDAVTQPRISKKLRTAIRLRARDGLPIKAACAQAGLSESGWFAAMKRAPVRQLLEDALAQAVVEIDGLRLSAKRLALETAVHLMQNARSETVRARMVEFLAATDKAAPSLTVNVDASSRPGYEYRPPGARIVEIEAASDDVTGSSDTDRATVLLPSGEAEKS